MLMHTMQSCRHNARLQALLVLALCHAASASRPNEVQWNAQLSRRGEASPDVTPAGCQTNGCVAKTSDSTNHEVQLREALFGVNSTYNKQVAPASLTKVDFGIQFYHLFAVDLFDGIVDVGGWLSLGWTDSRLEWNPAQYGGATRLSTVCAPMDRQASDVWAPHISMWNPGNLLKHTLSNQLCLVSNDGTVSWTRPGRIQSACKIDIAKFPFDKPVCELEFGSWVKPRTELVLETAASGTSVGWTSALPSAENAYQVTEVSASVAETSTGSSWSCRSTSNTCATSSVVKVSLSLKHEWKSFWWRYMVPQLLVTVGSFAVFWNEACSKERVAAGTILLLTGIVINSVASTSIPFTKDEAAMNSFFAMCFFWNLASLMETVMSDKAEASIELASPAEMERLRRAQEQTDLSDWLLENDLANIEKAFRTEEIHTLDDLNECRLTEQDLKDYIGIKDIYTRKRVGRMIRLLQGEPQAPATSSMAPILGALVDQIRGGMDNDELLVEVEDYKPSIKRKIAPPSLPPPPIDPDLAFDEDDYGEYWQCWSRRLDAFSKVAFPLGFLLTFVLQYLDWDMS